MNSRERRHCRGSALFSLGVSALLCVTALALAGCGRKGPLDLPPTASSQPAAVQGEPATAEQASKPSVFNSSYGADAPPAASKGSKRPFVLDPLLNSN